MFDLTIIEVAPDRYCLKQNGVEECSFPPVALMEEVARRCGGWTLIGPDGPGDVQMRRTEVTSPMRTNHLIAVLTLTLTLIIASAVGHVLIQLFDGVHHAMPS